MKEVTVEMLIAELQKLDPKTKVVTATAKFEGYYQTTEFKPMEFGEHYNNGMEVNGDTVYLGET